MVEIIHELPINGKKEDIYKALTTKTGLSSWWTSDVKAEEQLGSINEFGFYGHKAIHFMKVTDLEPFEKVEWVCEKSPLDEWVQTKINFSIHDSLAGVQLRLIHSGFKTTDMGYGSFNFNWANYLTSLKNFVETGKGSPHLS